MILEETYTLGNGVKIPKIGLGTWLMEGDAATNAVKEAARAGYRHIDTAQGYGNEAQVGEGVRTCGVPREEMFVTSKIDAFHRTYEAARASIDKSLSDAGLDYLDMMLIHSPQPWTHFREGERYFEENLEIWRAMEEAYAAGKLRAIGVSNFEAEDIDNLLANASVKPAANQVLAHIANTPANLIEHCEEAGVLVEAYSPIGHGSVLAMPEVASMAERYGVSPAQLCIRYCLQLGMVALPKASTLARMIQNANVDFRIADADMDTLLALETIEDYGSASEFPVYGGKMADDFTCTPGTFVPRS